MKGLEKKRLDVYRDGRGYLVSFRAQEKFFNGKFGQSLISFIYPNVIKGLHLHRYQTDFSACVKGNVLYVAVKGNKKNYEVESFVMGEENPLLIKVSPGIWHGYMALENEAIIMHAMDEFFNQEDEDTERRDPYYFGDLWGGKNEKPKS